MPSSIIGLGTALPNTVVSQSDAFALAKGLCCKTERQSRLLEQVYTKSGVDSRSTVLQISAASKETAPVFDRQCRSEEQRHTEQANFFESRRTIHDAGPTTAQRMAVYEEQAGPLATAACKAALHQGHIDSKQVTHLITVSCTGFFAPGFDLQLFNTLGLNPSVKRTHIGFMGCHGALNALRVANGFCSEDPNNVVLICATELCSTHFQYGWSRELLVSNALFADGAAAAIMSAENSTGLRHANSASLLEASSADWRDAKVACLRYLNSASHVIPNTHDAMSWKIGDSGFLMTLANNVPELIETHLPAFTENWLRENNLSISEINGWAVHPGGPRILDAVYDALHLQPDALDASRQILAECGNMSSPTVLFILEKLLGIGDKLPCVVLGFGPGLTIEAALIQ